MKKNALRLAIAFAVYILGVCLISGFEYVSTKNQILTSTNEQLKNAAHVVPAILGKTYHVGIAKKRPTNATYTTALINLNDAIKNTKIANLYSMIYRDGQVLFTSANASRDAIASQTYIQCMTPYDEATNTLKKAFNTSKPTFDDFEDATGHFHSILVPFTAPDGTRYIVGADIRMDAINAMLFSHLLSTIGKGAGLLVLLIPILWASWRNAKDEKAFLHAEIDKGTEEINALNENLIEQIKTAQAHEKQAQKAKEIAIEARTHAIQAGDDAKHEAAITLEESSHRLSIASEQLAAQVQQVANGAETQKLRAIETGAAIEEMNATVLEVASNAANAAEKTENARQVAESGLTVVEEVISAIETVSNKTETMRESLHSLGDRALGIGEIINVINDIADQTNLLALNAAIEAARAGEAGRGFSVVADEVRKLAEKTMSATKEVESTIGSIQKLTESNIDHMNETNEVVNKTTGLAEKAGQELQDIVSLVNDSSDRVRSIATASEEQSAASEQINQAATEINTICSETAEGMGQATEAIMDLASQSVQLKTLINSLKNDQKDI
ncbi:hypothetical protein GO013_08225 [Pseudodesulfovibrio sp. JC047]|uniref:methyl-accepting chemotaxis protein n=1 Tax=Pseudodesulfovibrio sp. JC047 TaxID=2683199 RepID=UPI0013D02DC1|nr:methyl-accepting chemotaxis protein [Pseudodesulfovibrio sp. JC047]NDV19403.1 hypothetical protein [Pseudodesulfovibrio sp. JC047]